MVAPPQAGRRGWLAAEDAVEGVDGVAGAGLLLGFRRGEVAVEARDRGVDVVRRRVLFEEIRDLLYLGDPAVGLVVHPRDALPKASEHLRLALGQLGDQRLAAAEARRAQQHCRGNRGGTLRDPGIGHLQRRRSADRPVDHAPVDFPIAQHCGLLRSRTRGVNRRAVARPGGPADDPALDKIAAGWRDDLADADRGLWADRVAVDINRLTVERLQRWRQTSCQRLRLAWR